MSRIGRPLVLCALLLIVIFPPVAPPGLAQADEHPAPSDGVRESTYPAQVANVSQEPWQVRKGENVKVTLTLHENASVPERVSMIWCRVEPDYVCALQLRMTQGGDGTWSATIPGAFGGSRDVVQEETRHIGYNISLHYAPGDANWTDRVWAPTHNTWTPVTFPQDTVGEYYFIQLADAESSPALPAPAILLLSLLLIGLGRSNGTRKKNHDQQEDGP